MRPGISPLQPPKRELHFFSGDMSLKNRTMTTPEDLRKLLGEGFNIHIDKITAIYNPIAVKDLFSRIAKEALLFIVGEGPGRDKITRSN